MPVLSYVHHLFDINQCHAYIHTLRWKDRPLQCPRCQSQDIDPWGTYHYRPGCKRSWCNGCQRTFNDLTNTLLHQSKRSLASWILATFLLCLSCSSRRIARELGLHISTSYRWCWWLRNTALSYETDRQLEGTVEADDFESREMLGIMEQLQYSGLNHSSATRTRRSSHMRVKLQLVLCSDEGHAETVTEVITLNKNSQRIEHLGLTMAEAKQLLNTLQRHL